MLYRAVRCLIPGMLLACPLVTQGIEPTAREPLTPPLFSIDSLSPSLGLGFLPGDVLSAPGPTIDIPAESLSLFCEEDDVDGLSFDNATITFQTFVLIFSVDRAAIGGVPPDPVLVAMGLPYNVQDQATKNQAAGDAYMSLTLFDRWGPISPMPRGPRGGRAANNTLVLNQGDAGGVHFELQPDISPEVPNRGGEDIDDVGAGAGTTAPAVLGRTDYIFFSVTRNSPSLPTLPGATPSGADIFIDNYAAAPGGEVIYVDPYQLGLDPLDDIDAFTVFDNGNHFFDPGIDQVLFSLTPDSPSLGMIFSPGDVFSSFGTGYSDLWTTAGDLGLEFADNLNMLDFVLCDDPYDCAYYWAIGYVLWPSGDAGAVDPEDVEPWPPGP